MTVAPDVATSKPSRGLLNDLARVLRSHLPRPRRGGTTPEPPTTEDAVLRALCHDMRSPLASLEAVLGSLDRAPEQGRELLELARAQTAHLSSMLRTADATAGAPPRAGTRSLRDVLQAATASSGLPRRRLSVEVGDGAGEVRVADARVGRILTNLLENAQRHGGGRPVLLRVVSRPGWVDLSLVQAGVPAQRVVGHLSRTQPPLDLTGLGLWSVQRQTRELGGRILWSGDEEAFTLTVQLPDR
ncbi:HAMP domain-containing sensor histidine kinase [Blastococcus sp. TF02A-35]|uniref:sensor histidine kinase n=1 Tax=Blastococcus sp. TF02A-35 TaxID=2559612 RepID=UPI0010732D2F|nr:HAMP domain-containing sensor histidine kinase [Blastococcus sp. TF02A_35]TFV53809.1 HAMP domain-containing histidine kinase [Blastococcus sp. TF02A_35]